MLINWNVFEKNSNHLEQLAEECKYATSEYDLVWNLEGFVYLVETSFEIFR